MPESSSTPYTSELSDRVWAILEPLLPPARPGGRPRSANLRSHLYQSASEKLCQMA